MIKRINFIKIWEIQDEDLIKHSPSQSNYPLPVKELICMVCFFLIFPIHYNKFKPIPPMAAAFLFQKNQIPTNYQIIDNSLKDKQLIAVKSNS